MDIKQIRATKAALTQIMVALHALDQLSLAANFAGHANMCIDEMMANRDQLEEILFPTNNKTQA